MSTFSHSLQPVRVRHLSLVQKSTLHNTAALLEEEPFAPADDGLGCMRGLAIAMLCNIVLALVGTACWELWRLLR